MKKPALLPNIFCNSVLTASYAREEKPISQIGQVVVGNLLLSLAENTPHTDPKLMDDPKLAEKLGLTKNGTFTILDQYAQANLYALLPSDEQLELFPKTRCHCTGANEHALCQCF